MSILLLSHLLFIDVLFSDSDDKLQQGYSDIKLKGPLYVGGVEPKLKDNYSLRAAGLHLDAFPGCVKNVRVDYRSVTNPILVSNKVFNIFV